MSEEKKEKKKKKEKIKKSEKTGKAEKRKAYLSAKTFIFLSILIVIVVCMAVYSVGMYYSFNSKMKKSVIDEVRVQADMIADQLVLFDYNITGENNTLDTDINQLANVLNGRVMVVTADYKIIKDTYVFMQGAYMVSSDVIDVMTGAKAKITDERNNYVEVMIPIYASDRTITGVVIATSSVQNKISDIQYIMNKSMIMLVIVLLVGILAAFVISKLSVREIDRINRQMSQMSDGNINDNMPIRGFRETRILAKNYNGILGKLSSIDSTRQEFVSNVSHELKTPITSMKVLAESVLQNNDATAAVYREFMDDIVDEIDRETKIINDLLVLVKTDKKSAALNIAAVDINELIEVILKRVTPIADTRGIELIYESYREVNAEVDEVKLSLALSNLIENAIKYNVDNGWVKVSLNADHKYFYVKVADTGVGIPDDCKELVFDRFYRVDKARSRDTGGTGLGLAIAKNSIVLHDGTIKLYSESGKGTTFTVKVPLRHIENRSE